MKKRKILLLSFVVLVAVSASGCGYNTLQGKQQQVRGRWADIEAQLQRRADLIPSLTAAAQSAGVQEQEVFGQIADARSRLLNATGAAPQGEGGDKSPEQKQAVIEAANSFGGTLGRLLSLQEAYPDLKSNQLFLNLQYELAGTENRIATVRKDYNDAAVDYNTSRGSFPTVISAKIFGFKEEPLYAADPGARSAPAPPDPNVLRRNQGGAAPPAPAPTTR